MCSDISLELICNDYFSNLNTISHKIAADIDNTKKAYQYLWSTLNETQKQQVIDDSIINPSIAIKYSGFYKKVSEPKCIYSYNWFTKSQLDLFKVLTEYVDVQNQNIITKCVKDVPVPDNSAHKKQTSTPFWDSNIMNTSSDILNKIKIRLTGYKNSLSSSNDKQTLIGNNEFTSSKPFVLKSKNLSSSIPPILPSSTTPEECEQLIESVTSKDEDTIPKTGFDFLDNW